MEQLSSYCGFSAAKSYIDSFNSFAETTNNSLHIVGFSQIKVLPFSNTILLISHLQVDRQQMVNDFYTFSLSIS